MPLLRMRGSARTPVADLYNRLDRLRRVAPRLLPAVLRRIAHQRRVSRVPGVWEHPRLTVSRDRTTSPGRGITFPGESPCASFNLIRTPPIGSLGAVRASAPLTHPPSSV